MNSYKTKFAPHRFMFLCATSLFLFVSMCCLLLVLLLFVWHRMENNESFLLRPRTLCVCSLDPCRILRRSISPGNAEDFGKFNLNSSQVELVKFLLQKFSRRRKWIYQRQSRWRFKTNPKIHTVSDNRGVRIISISPFLSEHFLLAWSYDPNSRSVQFSVTSSFSFQAKWTANCCENSLRFGKYGKKVNFSLL